MNRRKALQNVAILVGGTLSASTLFALVESCNSKSGSQGSQGSSSQNNGKAFSLDQDQTRLIEEISETILPKTNTPGAKEAKVPEFIQQMLKDCYTPEDQQIITEGLRSFEADCKSAMGKSFVELSVADKQKFLSGIEPRIFIKAPVEQTRISDDHSVAPKAASSKDTKTEKQAQNISYQYYKILKELCLLGYFTSEIGCTQALSYVKVPTRYEGSTKLKPGQKAWATS